MKAAELLVKCLEVEGTEVIFGVPGEENLDFVEALRQSEIRLVTTRHEQAAAFMAATVGRLTGSAGVCMSTLGPGATNLVTGAAYSYLGGMPMLMLTGQKPIGHGEQGDFQMLDIVHVMQSVTKATTQILEPDAIPSLVREYTRQAEHEKPGPAHLELPEDVAAKDTDGEPLPTFGPSRPVAPADEVERVARVVRAAERPLVLFASACNRRPGDPALRDFVDQTGMHFLTTQMGKGVIDERHPRSLGTAAVSANDFVHRAIECADLILNVGHDLSEKPPFIMRQNGRTVVHLSHSPAEVDEIYFPQYELVGAPATNLSALASALGERTWEVDYFSRVREAIDEHVYADHRDDDRFPILPQRIVADVREVMPDDGILSLDNGMYKLWFARHYPAHGPNTVLLDNALASMGAGLPAAIAAKLVHPDRAVVAICGDGGFMMNSAELETAIRVGLDLVVIILRDDALGMVEWKQQSDGFAEYGLEFGNPDFCAYAEAYGARGVSVESAAELRPALREAIDGGGVVVLDVPIDYSQNTRLEPEALAAASARLPPP